MRYAIIGTGAIGGFYGARLARAGQEVHFLLHSDYKYVCHHGLKIISPEGDFHLVDVNAYNKVEDMPAVDVVIVALKTTQQELLTELLPPLLGEHTLTLLIQNGIGLEADLAEKLPQAKLAAGLAFVCAEKKGPGVVEHYELGNIIVGNYNAEEECVQQLVDELKAAGIGAKSAPYQAARWKKALWNMPFNGLCVALHSTTDELVNQPETCQLLRDMMQEVVNAARANGVETLDESNIDALIEMTRKMKPYAPSMKVDWDYHRPIETHYLYTRPIEEAKRHGVDMPLARMLEAELRFMEAQRNKA